ncbi:MAG: hypothetical protein SGPRY_014664, partial [Prymnesium sp.]
FELQPRFARYASAHSLPFHFTPAPPGEAAFYQKPSTLRRAALSLKGVSWLWWIDCDSLVINQAIDPRSVLQQALQASGTPHPSFIASYETWGEHAGGYPINTGSFFVRRDPAGDFILERWAHFCNKKTNLIRINWNRDQSAFTRIKGFSNVPRGLRKPHRFFNGTAVALPDAPFNALLCPAVLRPSFAAVRLLHFARGVHSIGRCAPFYNPNQNSSEFSKSALVRLAEAKGVRAVWNRCCRCYPPLREKALRAGDSSSLNHIFSLASC